MAERKDGAVIFVGSIGGFRGRAALGIYGMSKAAEMQMARCMALEWGRHNIRINCIAPGLIRTDFSRAIWENPKLLAEREQLLPLGRIGEPDDIGGIALLLASKAGAFITGQVITADGGETT
jgi:NAD(P)-dependent dehydrogenase (short-subunit alcohol dehydrogenase family)